MSNVKERELKAILKEFAAEYGRGGDTGVIGHLADIMQRSGFNATLFNKKHHEGLSIFDDIPDEHKDKPYNLIFKKDSCPYVLIMVRGKDIKKLQMLLIDTESCEIFKNRLLYLNASKSSCDYRAHMSKDGKSVKLHDLIAGRDAGKEEQVDHVTCSGSICTKEMLRRCYSRQNSWNKKRLSEINERKKYSYFTINRLVIKDDETLKELESRGHKLIKAGFCKDLRGDTYSFASRKFQNEDKAELYEEINRIENQFLGEFRYNPIYAFDDLSDEEGTGEIPNTVWLYLYMYMKMFGVSEEEFVALRKDYLKENYSDLCKFYNIA